MHAFLATMHVFIYENVRHVQIKLIRGVSYFNVFFLVVDSLYKQMKSSHAIQTVLTFYWSIWIKVYTSVGISTCSLNHTEIITINET